MANENDLPQDGPDMAPYSARDGSGNPLSASGGWTTDPGANAKNPVATGSESMLTHKFPASDGGRSYSITAIKGRGDGGFGYANPNFLVDAAGQRPYYDLDNSDQWHARKPTTSAIIQWAQEQAKKKESGADGGNKRPYKYTDFVFCKHWNKIPNNYMITLRRYAYPVYDNLQFPGENGGADGVTPSDFYSPYAQAVTYIGEDTGNDLSSMLKFSAKLPYEDKTSKVHKVSTQSPGAGDGPGAGLAKVMGLLTGGADYDTISRDGTAPNDPYEGGPYANKIYGPVNVIDTVKSRKQGLQFDQKFSIKFHYVARPIGGVNTKAAMLEIIANLLVLCYAEGSFWGGAHRFTAGKPAYPFLGGDAGAQALYNGDIGGFIDAFTNQLTQAADNLSGLFDAITSDPIEGLKSMAAGGAKLGLAKMLAGKRKNLANIPALLTGAPVGEWHLTIGNPFNPMLEIGNLVCTGINFEFGKELGPDDFPLELTATIDLEHGMARDKAAIESMFNRGGGKIYHLPDSFQFPEAFGEDGRSFKKANTKGNVNGGGKGGNSVERPTSDFFPTEKEVNKIEGSGLKLASTSGKIASDSLEFIKIGYGYGTPSNKA